MSVIRVNTAAIKITMSTYITADNFLTSCSIFFITIEVVNWFCKIKERAGEHADCDSHSAGTGFPGAGYSSQFAGIFFPNRPNSNLFYRFALNIRVKFACVALSIFRSTHAKFLPEAFTEVGEVFESHSISNL